ncbi:TPA: single-stranded DNA-binding protein [Corynebacterium striatum]|nr:single-stranded DNA-binding protein [Corynebacterium striatum]
MAIDIITITGGLPRDAELRFTSQGAAVTNFTLASSDNRYDEQQKKWVKTRAMYLDVTIWDESTERKQNPVQWARLASELKQGDQVAVKGKLTTRTWETDGGEKRSKMEFLATSFYRMPNTQGAPNGQQARQNVTQGLGAQAASDPWNSAPQGGFSGADANPPF